MISSEISLTADSPEEKSMETKLPRAKDGHVIWMLAGSKCAGKAMAIAFILIGTAKHKGVNLHAWIINISVVLLITRSTELTNCCLGITLQVGDNMALTNHPQVTKMNCKFGGCGKTYHQHIIKQSHF
jgi:hypothetical protein